MFCSSDFDLADAYVSLPPFFFWFYCIKVLSVGLTYPSNKLFNLVNKSTDVWL